MFFVCPKLTFDAEPENVIEFRPSAPSAFDALATRALASWALAPVLTNVRITAVVTSVLTIRCLHAVVPGLSRPAGKRTEEKVRSGLRIVRSGLRICRRRLRI